MKYTPKKWRLLRALALTGHPRIKTRAAWLFIIPQFVFYLYFLAPVFIYFTKGVPPKESLEVIEGTWREVGKMSSGRSRLYPPRYVIDTERGAREVHCGFRTQKALCGPLSGSRPGTGDEVKIFYDSYFGILAYEHVASSKRVFRSMDYALGVALYAQPNSTVHFNKNAHVLLPLLLAGYMLLAGLCWKALGDDFRPTPWSVD